MTYRASLTCFLTTVLALASVTACARNDADDGAESSEHGVTETTKKNDAETLAATIEACATEHLGVAPLDDSQRKTLTDVFETFSSESCGGCHYTKKSYGSTGNFTLNAAPDEFFKGLALRHHTTRDIALRCFEKNAARDQLMTALTSRIRIQSTAGVEIKMPGAASPVVGKGGVLFFGKGTENEMREQVVSFLQGGFEVPAQPGDSIHDAVYTWVSSGAVLGSKAHAEILADVIRGNGLDAKVVPARQ